MARADMSVRASPSAKDPRSKKIFKNSLFENLLLKRSVSFKKQRCFLRYGSVRGKKKLTISFESASDVSFFEFFEKNRKIAIFCFPRRYGAI